MKEKRFPGAKMQVLYAAISEPLLFSNSLNLKLCFYIIQAQPEVINWAKNKHDRKEGCIITK